MNGPVGTVASAVARSGGTLARQVRSVIDPSSDRPAGGGAPASGWLAVTVLREPSEIPASPPPPPLGAFGDRVEVRVRPAPSDKGTELAVRLRGDQPSAAAPTRLLGSDPRAELRSALRRAKQLLEVGEVLAVDPVPHGDRTPTPGGVLLEAWTRIAPKAGVL